MHLIYRIIIKLRKFVGWSVAVLLAWMVLLALLQVVLRWTFSIGIPWADLQLRQLVLWIGLLGGAMAAAENRHIRIDLLEHYLDNRLRSIIRRVVTIIAGMGSICLCVISISFISSEKEAGVIVDGLLFGMSIPIWTTQIIIPIGFGLIGLFFLIRIPPSFYKKIGDR
ncbi:MAG: TRAP transporter small permease [Candidatus Hatepunaea meridiana]|nr:TRAP transporter small permease [Candidatus Hatepunaea meridiana]